MSEPERREETCDRSRFEPRPELLELLVQELPRLRAFVRLRMGSELRVCESASDIVQSVSLELLRRRAPFEWRGRDSFRHWLFVTALHKIRQYLRHHRVRRRGSTCWSDVDELQLAADNGRVAQPLQTLQAKEALSRLQAAFDALPLHYAEVITLRRLRGLSYAAIAARRGSTQAAVRVLLHRALARLAVLFERAGG